MSDNYPPGVTPGMIDDLFWGEHCRVDEDCTEPLDCDRCKSCSGHCICDETAEERAEQARWEAKHGGEWD